jgi:hypothetical protein
MIFIALTVVSGSAALILGDRINEKQAEQLRQFNAELITAKEHNLELEQSITPRWLDQTHLEELKKFAGTEVILEYLLDAEPRNAAGQIRFVLHQAQWKIIDDKPVLEIEGNPSSGITLHGQTEAAETLAAFLTAQKWDVQPVAGAIKLPANAVKISIGFKPNRFLQPVHLPK